MSQRFEGHNLEEALNNAASGLGVERYQISHRIIVEKRGFLGGIKRVVIEADVNPDAAEPVPAIAAIVEAAPSLPPVLSARPSRGGRGARGGGRRDRGEKRGRSEFGDRGARRERNSSGRGHNRGAHGSGDQLLPGDFEKFTGEIPEQSGESETAKAVRDWLERVISLAGIDVVIRTEENPGQVLVRFFGGDGLRLIERNGELLDALQVIANKALVGRKVEKEIELDCDQFKERRTEEIGGRARDVADRVRRDGHEQLLPAMSPVERRIVHLALRDDAEVTTESRGEGFYKRVAIIVRPPAESGSES
jgi:spoIIIJ-associated protein